MPPNRFESEVESFLEGSHGDRTHIKRADHHTVTPLCGTLLPPSGNPRAHPRSRGENPVERCSDIRRQGSSPLTRGKRRATKPARPRAVAHPRSRGENVQQLPSRILGVGSSPLTRGKLTEQARKKETTRLIPAHAGKTERCPGGHGRGRAHPRSRGENGDTLKPETWGAGSSPLTRGKPVTQQLIF